MNKKFPLVSIITVVYNDGKLIEETIKSVLSQNYLNKEYIIIDGGSNDETTKIIKKYEDEIAYWVSEPDKGIYDAMNKGITASKGEWLNFLNAGDSFIDDLTLERIFNSKINDGNLIYGNIKALKENGDSIYRKAGILKNERSLMLGMKICHQAIFYHRSIIEYYDASLKLKGEWKQLIKISRNPTLKAVKIEFPVVLYRIGGMGAKNIKMNQHEFRKVFLKEYGLLIYILFIPFFVYQILRRLIKKFLLKNVKYENS